MGAIAAWDLWADDDEPTVNERRLKELQPQSTAEEERYRSWLADGEFVAAIEWVRITIAHYYSDSVDSLTDIEVDDEVTWQETCSRARAMYEAMGIEERCVQWISEVRQ